MSKKHTLLKTNPVDDKFRLHVELSKSGGNALAFIRRFKMWNKKTAVDAALEHYVFFLKGGAK